MYIAPAMFLSAQMHATLRLVHVRERAPNPTYRAPAWDEFFRAQDEAYLESLAERIQSGVTTTVDCSVLDGDVVMAICASIEASASPMVIMSTHGLAVSENGDRLRLARHRKIAGQHDAGGNDHRMHVDERVI